MTAKGNTILHGKVVVTKREAWRKRVSCTNGAGLNDGLSQKRWTIVTLPPVLIPLCVSRRIDTWQIVYLSYKDPCPTISIRKSEIHVPDSDGTCANSQASAASCKLVPLG